MILDSPIITGSLTQQAGQFAEIPRYTEVSSSLLVVSASLNAKINALNTDTGSQASRLSNLETTSASVNVSISNINSVTASFSPRVSNLESKSASVDISISNINAVTASNIARLSNLESKSASVDISISSINTFTSSNSNTSLNSYTASNDTTNTTQTGRLNNLESKSSSVDISITSINSFTASNNITSLNSATSSYETNGRGIVSGSTQVTLLLPTGVFSGSSQLENATITNLTITNLTTVNETASVIFSSGSNRFGDFGDDIHSFTGSVKISGSIITLGESTATSFSGQINATNGVVSGSSQVVSILTSLNIYTGSNDTTNTTQTGRLNNLESKSASVDISISNINSFTASNDNTSLNAATSSYETKGRGIISGSAQLPIGLISGSSQLTSSYDTRYVVSGSITQTTWDNIASKPDGIVSGSSQLTSSYDTRYVISGSITQTTWDNIASKPAGIVSGSSQVVGILSSLNQFTSSYNTGSFTGSFKGDGSLLSGLTAGGKIHTQSTPASTWTFTHNLNIQYPNVTVYDTNGNVILPQTITATDVNTLTLNFGANVAGYAVAGIGGIINVQGRTTRQYFTSSLNWNFTHNLGDQYVNVQTIDDTYNVMIPQTITLTDSTSSAIVFPELTSGWAIATIGGNLPSIDSSQAGFTLQISSQSPYSASWVAVPNVTVTNALTASHLNPISQSLIPAISGTYDLGSQNKPWRHIYVGSGSIFLVDDKAQTTRTISAQTIVTTDTLNSGSISLINSLPTGTVSGSLQVVDILTSLNTATASFSPRILNLESKSASVDISISNINSITASNIARLSNLESKSASVDISLSNINSVTASNIARLSNLENTTGSFATTGSNTFYGTQVFSGSVFIATDLIVQGSSSIQYISASSVSIGTNIVQLNTATPSVRFAGMSVQDSGSSAGITGSMLWDSLCNRWIYSNPSTIGYSGGMLLSGPRASTLGSETTLTCNYVAKSGGGDHLYDSCIYESGSYVGINTNSPYTNGLSVKGTADDYSLTILQQNANTAGYGFFAGNSGDFSIARLSGGAYITPALKIQLNTNIACFGGNVCVPNLDIANTGRATLRIFSGPTDNESGIELWSSYPSTAERNWRIGTSDVALGDFVIKSSITCGGNPDTGACVRLRIDNAGVATFACSVTAAAESEFKGTSVNTRILITASGVANTVIGFNNSGATTTGVINNAAYVGVLQAYPLIFTTSEVERFRIASTGAACFTCELTAKTIGTNDLILNNLNYECANYVDGTRGSWLIQEGESDLFIINQISCKKYKFNLTEIK